MTRKHSRLLSLQVEEVPGPVHASGTAGGPLESGGGDKTKPFVQNAVTVQDEDVGAGAAPSRPAAAVPAGGAPRGDGGLVRNIYPPPPRKCSNGVREIARCPCVRASIDFLGCRRPHVQSCSSGGGSCLRSLVVSSRESERGWLSSFASHECRFLFSVYALSFRVGFHDHLQSMDLSHGHVGSSGSNSSSSSQMVGPWKSWRFLLFLL